MICSRCGTMNADSSAFCMNCGNKLESAQNTNVNMNVAPQNNQVFTPVQNNQDFAPVQNNQGFIPEQNNQNFVPVQNSQGFMPEQNNQNFVPEQNSQGFMPEQNNQNFVPEQNNQAFVSEQNNQGFMPEQNNQNFVPAQNYQGFAGDQNNAGYVPDPNGVNYGENPYGNFEYAEQPAPKKNKWLMPAIIGGAALTAIIIVIVVLINSIGGRFIVQENMPAIFPCDGTVYLAINGEKLDTKIDAEKVSGQSISADGSVFTFIADETLYVVEDSDVKEIADGVKSCRLAQNGGAVIFVDSEGVTYYYNLDDEEKVKISSDEIASLVISPDGNTIVYSEKNEDGASVYMRNGSDKIEIGKNFGSGTRVLGVSDDGDYIYIRVNEKGENEYDSGSYKFRVYLDAGEDYNDIVTDMSNSTAYFNNDYTQVLFYHEDKMFVSVEGEDRVQLSSKSLYPLTPANVTSSGITSFFDLVYYSYEDGDIYYVNSDGEDYKLDSNTKSRKIDADGDVVYYIKNNTLYSVDAEENPMPKALMDDVDSFAMSVDGEEIYFERDDELYYYEGINSAEKIKSDVEDYAISGEGICFFLCGERLYISDGGSKAESIDDEVDQLAVTYWYAAYLKGDNSVQQTYMSTGDDDFEMVAEKSVKKEVSSDEYYED